MIAFDSISCIPCLGSIGIPLIVFLVLLGAFLLYLGLKAQKRPKLTGEEEMIDLTGVVKTTVGFRGRASVEVRGELWWCRSTSHLQKDMNVRVVGITDMMLDVEPDSIAGEGV